MRTKSTILIAEDDHSLRQVLKVLLQEEGFDVILAGDGHECLRLAYEHHPDLILLDIMMPNKDGREACKELRALSNVPIIILSARPADKEMVGRLTDGADDYVSKPYRNEELIARIKAVLRRSHSEHNFQPRAYDDGFLRIDFESRTCCILEAPVIFTPKEWRLLECFLSNPNRLVPREILLRHAWGSGYEKEYALLKVFIHTLRRKLREPARQTRYIHTERALGYRFATYPRPY